MSSCQTEDGHSLDGAAAVDPVLRREFLDELQKVRQIPICERLRLPRIFVSSKIQKCINDVNAIIDSLKDEPDMSAISYLVYTSASLVSNRHGSKTAKTANSHTPTWRSPRFVGQSLCCRRLERAHQAFGCCMSSDSSGGG